MIAVPHVPPGQPGGDDARPLTLILPRPALDEQLALALSQRTTQPGSSWLAHGPLVLQAEWHATWGLVGGLQAGQPSRLASLAAWPRGQHDNSVERSAPQGLAMFYLAADDEALPGGTERGTNDQRSANDFSAAWDAWIARMAPEYRLASVSLMPNLVVLWMRADGLVALAFRPGDAWRAMFAIRTETLSASERRAWRPVSALHLPGTEMLRLSLQTALQSPPLHRPQAPAQAMSRSSAVVQPEAHASNRGGDAEDTTQGRYSRQAGALGPVAFARLQHSRFAMVGTGRIGSVLAHSLARMGCSLLLIEPDLMSPHSLDGDLPPLMEGRPKAEGMQRQLRGLLRPGAALDARVLPVASPAAGALLADCDMVICCVDNDAARLWANAWALALLKPLLVIATDLHAHGAEADVHLLPPGAGCLACTGGFAQMDQLPAQLTLRDPPPTPADFRQQRRGSLRSWGVLAAHVGLRMVEQMYAGRIGLALFRRLAETEAGGLEVQDWTPPASRRLQCPMCRRLLGVGSSAVQPTLLTALAQQLLASRSGSRTFPAAAP